MQEMISNYLYYSAFLFQLVGYIMLYWLLECLGVVEPKHETSGPYGDL